MFKVGDVALMTFFDIQGTLNSHPEGGIMGTKNVLGKLIRTI